MTDDEWLNTSPAWLPGGSSLLYVSNREGGRDLYQVELGRSGRPAHEAVRLSTGLNAATVSVAADGEPAGLRDLLPDRERLVDADSPLRYREPEPGAAGDDRQPGDRGVRSIARRRWLAFDSNRGGVQQIYRMPMPGGDVEQLTSGDSPSLAPAFSFDGREVVFHSFRDGVRQIFVMPVEGGTPVQVTAEKTHSRIANWSPDGRSIVLREERALARTGDRDREPGRRVDAGAPREHCSREVPPGSGVPTGPRSRPRCRSTGGSSRWQWCRLEAEHPGYWARRRIKRTEELGWAFSRDSKFVYYIPNKSAGERAGSGGSRWMEAHPSRWRGTTGVRAASAVRRVRVRGDRLYINIGDPQSDVWVTEIVK